MKHIRRRPPERRAQLYQMGKEVDRLLRLGHSYRQIGCMLDRTHQALWCIHKRWLTGQYNPTI